MAVTSKQIAEIAGVSRGTVDRALHNRGRVKPEVAERIRSIAAELGYQPHPAGQALALSSKSYRFGVYVQSLSTPTMQIVYDGVQRAVDELTQLGVTTQVITNPHFDKQAELQAIDTLLSSGCQALAVIPTTDNEIVERINQVVADGIPVITFNCDVPDSNRLCYVGMDNDKGGKTAAALMGYMLPNGGKVLPITAHLTNNAHHLRITSFSDVIHSDFPNLELLPLQGCFDSDNFSYEITKYSLQQHPDIQGIYAACHGAHGVVRAVCEAGLSGKVRIISFDLNDNNVADLRQGHNTLILDQHPELQGYRALRMLYDHVAKGISPADRNAFTDFSVITKYNLP